MTLDVLVVVFEDLPIDVVDALRHMRLLVFEVRLTETDGRDSAFHIITNSF